MANLKNTSINDTGFFKLPAGDTAARPASPTARQLRFNTDTGQLEQFRPGSGAWIAPSNTGVIATGGDAVYDVDAEGTTYRVHVFTSTGTSTFSVLQGGEAEYLIVAGGGGGGSNRENIHYGSGGGGAGGVITTAGTQIDAGTYAIVVGGGGIGAGGEGGAASNGEDSVFLNQTAIGGGAGGGRTGTSGGSGGSGGGGGSLWTSTRTTPGGSGTLGQGNNGGNGFNTSGSVGYASGGGGGAGGPAQDATNDSPTAGGIGIVNNYSGTSVFYGGGGGATAASIVRPGGLGGGGDAAYNADGLNGVDNTGGGGGGGKQQDGIRVDGGAGGSGIVIIRYPLRQNNPETAAGQDVRNGLVLDLDFAKPTVYSGSGSVVSDSRLNGLEGDFVNSPDFQDARTHRSNFRFPGNQRATLSSSLEQKLDGNPEATLIMWLKLDSVTASTGNNGLIQLSAYTSSNGNLYPWGSNSRIYLDIFRTDRYSTNVNLSGIGTFWHMLTVTTQPGSNGWKMYLNNNLEYQNTGQSVVSVNASLFNGFTIGQNSGGRDLLGNIGLVRIHNIALSSTQVDQFYEATRWRFGV